VETIAWLDERTGGQRAPAIQRAMAAGAVDDAQAERSESERRARLEDQHDARLLAMRSLGIGAGHMTGLGLQLGEASAKCDDLKAQLQRAEMARDQLRESWAELNQRLADASELAQRSAILTTVTGGPDLLAEAKDAMRRAQEDAPLIRARARSALARIAQLDRQPAEVSRSAVLPAGWSSGGVPDWGVGPMIRRGCDGRENWAMQTGAK